MDTRTPDHRRIGTSVFHYDPGVTPTTQFQVLRGQPRVINSAGRAGVIFDDAWGSLLLGPHHLAENQGTLSLWILPMEEMNSAAGVPEESLNVTDAEEFTLISDRETVKDSRAAHFSITWHSRWTPSLFVKRFPGHVYEAFHDPPCAVATAGHFAFRGGVWHQVIYSWNRSGNRHKIYVNGILVGSEDAHANGPMRCSEPGPWLCVGSSMFASGAVTGFAEEFGPDESAAHFAREVVEVDAELQQHLEKTYLGKGLARFTPPSGQNWETHLDLPFANPDDLKALHIQGNPSAPRIDDDGLRITTSPNDPSHSFAALDLSHVYLWSRQPYEGDLHLSYEFQNLKRGGLSLLMTRCTGMQREDFFKYHRPRTNGIMKPVCWEDIRNYHWEYLREMNDVRNDAASHAMLKNPWQQVLGFGVHGPLYTLGKWQRLDFLQCGSRIQCAINGDVVLDATDRSDINCGPVFNTGRFAIRCMTRTDIRIRNLKVVTRPIFAL